MTSKGVRLHVNIFPKDPSKMKEELGALVKEVRAEKGCLLYEVFEQVNVEGGERKFALMEHWESQEALDAHLKTPHVKVRKFYKMEIFLLGSTWQIHSHGWYVGITIFTCPTRTF